MIIRCWGARGSIPVSGPQYAKYGGDTPCIEIRTGNDEVIVVDAGTGVRRLGSRLVRENRKRMSMIFTHSHWDHIIGFPFFKPVHSGDSHIDVYGCPRAMGNIGKLLAETMKAPFFPVPFQTLDSEVVYNKICRDSFRIDSVKVSHIQLSHPNLGLGYRFEENGSSFVFLTDNELSFKHRGGRDFDDYLEFAKGADFLIHDAEFTEEEYTRTRSWGHSVYTQALDLAIKAGVRRFGLYHHNQDRTDNALDDMVDHCRRIITQRGADMECFACSQNLEIELI